MKGILLASTKRTCKALAVATLLSAVSLAAHGEIGLLGALLVGYAAGAAWVGSLAWRTWASVGRTASSAKRIMLWGLALRLGILFAVLVAAIYISLAVFSAVAAGFLLFYAVAMASLMVESMKE